MEIQNIEKYPQPIDCCNYPYITLQFTVHSNILDADVLVWTQINPDLEDEILVKLPNGFFPKTISELPDGLRREVYEALKQVERN